jgi:hypothetical protein
MRRFTQQIELIKFARDTISEWTNSLEKDVKYCLQGAFAPFPALLYCFATIDFLGALYSGRADNHATTTQQSISYITRFMNYNPENADFLLNLFRHKLVHLAQPDPVIRHGSELITWRYHHDNQQHHLKKIRLEPNSQLFITSNWNISITHEFNISTMDFVRDIIDSVNRPNGYLDLLEKTPYLQDNFENAIAQLYEA